MKKYRTKLGKITSSIICGIILSLLAVSNVSAWGPERATFTMDAPATYPTFNSITDNPTIGDERDFVKVGKINADVTELDNEVEVIPGNQYLVYVYFHNNASSTFNLAEYNHSGIATATKMATSFSTTITPTNKGTITATISAENSNPGSVWDEAYMTTSRDMVLLRYVEGSAKIYNDFETNGSVMPSSLFTIDGAYLTLKNNAVGAIPGCEEYHGVVSYVLEASELKGTVNKTVSKDGVNYSENLDGIKAGDTLNYKITIENKGDVELTNATIRDSLPTGLNYVTGSVKLMANNSGKTDSLSDNLFANGYNLGTIGTGNKIEITYQAKVSGDYDCTGTNLTNTAKLTYDSTNESGITVEDSTKINVVKADCQKTCATNPEMEGCQKIPNTGPLEIVMAIIIILGIGGGGYYLYRTKKNLKKVSDAVKGDTKVGTESTTEEPKDEQ